MESSEKGVLVCSGASSEMERWSRCFAGSVLRNGGLKRVRMELNQEEELLILFLKRRDRRSGFLGGRSLFNFWND